MEPLVCMCSILFQELVCVVCGGSLEEDRSRSLGWSKEQEWARNGDVSHIIPSCHPLMLTLLMCDDDDDVGSFHYLLLLHHGEGFLPAPEGFFSYSAIL